MGTSSSAVTNSPLFSKVKIGAFTYVVEYDDRLEENSQLGRINFLRGTIGLRPDMSLDIERLTLIHELLHGLLFQAGIKEDVDERLIDVLAHGIIQAVADNEGLLG